MEIFDFIINDFSCKKMSVSFGHNSPCSCLSCVLTARIFVLFNLSSAVQIYDVSYIHFHLFIIHGYITNSQYDQLPVGLIAQLVEHCTGIAEVMGSNPVQASIFFRLSFRNCLSCATLSVANGHKQFICLSFRPIIYTLIM